MTEDTSKQNARFTEQDTEQGTKEAESSSPTPGKYTVALLFGGNSNEREVSLDSAANVQKVLSEAGHEVIMLDISQPRFFKALNHAHADVAFIALHGKGGEDGCIQGALELLGIPYTGSGVLSSALAMDKYRSKIIYEAAGLKTPHSVLINTVQKDAKTIKPSDLIAELGLPCVVKPASDGSSVGVSIVHTEAELPQALDKAFAAGDTVLVETFIKGTEITVPVLGAKTPQILPAIEIIPAGEFYDYQSKYDQGGSKHIVPARIAQEVQAEASKAALAAHLALDCWGVSRTDMIIDDKNTVWVIETNTVPGMTATSLLPDAANFIGIDNLALYELFIQWAFERANQ